MRSREADQLAAVTLELSEHSFKVRADVDASSDKLLRPLYMQLNMNITGLLPALVAMHHRLIKIEDNRLPDTLAERSELDTLRSDLRFWNFE